MLPQEIFFNVSLLRLFLVASETQLGRSLSVISTGSPLNVGWGMSPPACSAKLQIVYG